MKSLLLGIMLLLLNWGFIPERNAMQTLLDVSEQAARELARPELVVDFNGGDFTPTPTFLRVINAAHRHLDRRHSHESRSVAARVPLHAGQWHLPAPPGLKHVTRLDLEDSDGRILPPGGLERRTLAFLRDQYGQSFGDVAPGLPLEWARNSLPAPPTVVDMLALDWDVLTGPRSNYFEPGVFPEEERGVDASLYTMQTQLAVPPGQWHLVIEWENSLEDGASSESVVQLSGALNGLLVDAAGLEHTGAGPHFISESFISESEEILTLSIASEATGGGPMAWSFMRCWVTGAAPPTGPGPGQLAVSHSDLFAVNAAGSGFAWDNLDPLQLVTAQYHLAAPVSGPVRFSVEIESGGLSVAVYAPGDSVDGTDYLYVAATGDYTIARSTPWSYVSFIIGQNVTESSPGQYEAPRGALVGLTHDEPVKVMGELVVMPPADQDYTAVIHHAAHAPALLEAGDVSWWSDKHPDILMLAIKRQVELDLNRNKTGVRDYDEDIEGAVYDLETDAAMESQAGPSRAFRFGWRP